MAGLKVVAVKVNSDGTLDLHDLKAKAEKHKDNLAAFMVRLPFHVVLFC
jgi:glycine dehydrogenase